ncbi:FHA domain-containing protein [Arthrobacter sp. S39]|uniref:FHA domain-containing protein n=1 Tax=Arthrobacter sp. S39 TaxID=2509720 RepID=UPI00103820D8|nr:FHA domain-containing protein [Arthrobacter sp. S39]TAP44350.1 FHA domain-containing protein [Arthrobacter sp. S39]
MAANNYVPGTWLGIVRSGTAILLGPGTPPQLVHSLWELLESRPEVHELLHAVTSSFGVSLAGIPPFGIVDFQDSLRIFLRGDLDLTVQLAGGPVALHGRDVTTWAERHLTAPEWYRLSVPGGDPAGQSLPLQEGVVLLQALTVGLDGGVGAAAAMPVAGQRAAPAIAADPVAVTPVVLPSPEHGASAETVIGVMDEDDEDLPAREPDAGPAENAASPAEEAVPPAEEEPASNGAVPASEQTSTYDHLWERTVVRSIEDAAVRDDPDGLPVDEAPEKPAPAAPELPSAGETPPAVAPLAAAAAAAAAAPAPAPVPAGGLIDSVPWSTGGAIPPVRGSVPAPASGGHDDGDHDGQTIMKSDLARMAAHPAPAAGPGAAGSTGPMVLARVCGQGHANPPTHAQCAACGQPLPSDAVQVPRPRLGRMRVSSGELVDLEQSLVIGRQPSVSRVQGGVMPRLVQVASPSGDISRSHVEVRLEGWHVMLCDLKATNGTVLVREGQQPRRLAQNEMAILLDGDIAELGDGISLRFEEIL